MNTPYRQYSAFGCGSYTLANIFKDGRFIEEVPVGQGERVADLNKKMDLYQPEMFVNCMYMTNFNLPNGNRLRAINRALFSYEGEVTKEQKNKLARPFVISFARPNGQLHSVGLIHDLKTRLYYMVDSCEPLILQGTLLKFIKDYHIVGVSQFGVWAHKDNANFAMFHREEFNHIFK